MIMKHSFLLVTVAGLSVLSAGALAQDAPSAAGAAAVESPATPSEITTPVPTETPMTEAPVIVDVPAPDAQTSPPVDTAASANSAVTTESAPTTPEAAQVPVTEAEKKDADIDASRQEKTVPLPELSEEEPIDKEILQQLRLRKPPVDIEKMPSLFLTVWERDLIINARKGQLTRDPDAPIEELATLSPEPLTPYEGPRDLRLSGIVYRDSKDWVIWLNAKRVSPTALLPEIMDIKVYKDYIELEWFDAGTNQIFPIRLRPHQRFNMDARVFLPG